MPPQTGVQSRRAADLFEQGVQAYDSGDDILASSFYQQAADLGHSQAQIYIGYNYEFGKTESGKQDLVEAAKWFTKAAVQGSPLGQYQLARCFEFGRGVEKDVEEAKRLYKLAAEAGHEMSREALERVERWEEMEREREGASCEGGERWEGEKGNEGRQEQQVEQIDLDVKSERKARQDARLSD